MHNLYMTEIYDLVAADSMDLCSFTSTQRALEKTISQAGALQLFNIIEAATNRSLYAISY